MTWDEKYLEALEKLVGRLYESKAGPRALQQTFVIEYRPKPPTTYGGLMRYWLLSDGTALKWSLGSNQWQEIGSPRVKRALFMRAWPEWAPSGDAVPRDWFRTSRRVYLPLDRNSQMPCIRIIEPT
jgi:hypothetical protein